MVASLEKLLGVVSSEGPDAVPLPEVSAASHNFAPGFHTGPQLCLLESSEGQPSWQGAECLQLVSQLVAEGAPLLAWCMLEWVEAVTPIGTGLKRLACQETMIEKVGES